MPVAGGDDEVIQEARIDGISSRAFCSRPLRFYTETGIHSDLQLRFNRVFFQVLLLVCGFALPGLTGCRGFDLLNAPISSAGYHRDVDIPYGPFPRQKLDVYQPCHAKPDARVVIFIYGGEWQVGQKGDYRFAAEALTSRGFIAVVPDYRLYPNVTFPAFVDDAAKAVRWTHDNIARFGGDPSHLYLMGHSAGAHRRPGDTGSALSPGGRTASRRHSRHGGHVRPGMISSPMARTAPSSSSSPATLPPAPRSSP